MRKILAALAPVLLGGALALTTGVLPAHAATVCAPLATNTTASWASPIRSEQTINASDWGGSGNPATACTGALVNDPVKTWQYSAGGGHVAAGAASDLTAVSTGGGHVQFVYTPGNEVSTTAPLCISTVLDQQGAYVRLRPCAGLTVTVNTVTGAATIVQTTGNQWQNFTVEPAGDGFDQIVATQEAPPFALNISGYGGNGTQVISWPPFGTSGCSGMTCAENQIFEQLAAA
jgi:hypothetical protein